MTVTEPTIAAALSRVQAHHNISQNRLAAALGIPKTHISPIVHGKRKPSAETLFRIQKWGEDPELARGAIEALPQTAPHARRAGRPQAIRSDMRAEDLSALMRRFNISLNDLAGWLGTSKNTVYRWVKGLDRLPIGHAERIKAFDWNTMRFTSRVYSRNSPFMESSEFKPYRLTEEEMPSPFTVIRGLKDFYQPALLSALHAERATMLSAAFECRRRLLAWDDHTGNPVLQEAYEDARRAAELVIRPYLWDHDLDHDYTTMVE